MNYKKYYEKQCKIKIPKGFEIHHIDMNRENNNIENLVMLPKKLHKEYHKKLIDIQNGEINICTEIKSIIECGSSYNAWVVDRLNDFVETWIECCRWNDYKYYLLGLLPNIYGYEVNKNVDNEESKEE